MFDSSRESIRDRVKDLRQIRKVNQKTLADYIEISLSTYQNHESQGAFTWDELGLIADFFDESPYFLKYGTTDDELADLVSRYESVKFSALHDVNFTIFDNFEEETEKIYRFADFVSLGEEERNAIIKYIKSKNL